MQKLDIESLKQSNLFLNTLYQNVTSAIFLADAKAVIYSFNDSFSTLFYKQEDQIIGKLCGNVIGCVYTVDENRDCGKTSFCENCHLRTNILKAYKEKGAVFKEHLDRTFYIQKTKICKHLLFSTRYMRYLNQDMVLIIVDDITELEEKRKEVQDYYSSVIEEMNNKVNSFYSIKEELETESIKKEAYRSELQHRLGNTLQVISSLLQLNAYKIHDAQALQSLYQTAERIDVVKILYKNIERSDSFPLQVSTESYLKSLLQLLHMTGSKPGDLPALLIEPNYPHISIDCAMPLGMIINETLHSCNLRCRKNRVPAAHAISLRQLNSQHSELLIERIGEGTSLLQCLQEGYGIEFVATLCTQILGKLTFQSINEDGKNRSLLIITFPTKR